MSIMKKLMVTAALSAAMFASAANAEPVKIGLVVKSLGNGFFDAANKGAQEAAKEIGDVEVIYTGPTSATAEGQIEIVNSLVAQQVNAIAISANDPDALVPALKKAMDRGITVISWDSGVAPEGRQVHLNPSDTNLIGETIIKLAATICPRAATSRSCLRLRPRPTRTPGSTRPRRCCRRSSRRSTSSPPSTATTTR
jgi:rhamnose transport system substrate-binding protein